MSTASEGQSPSLMPLPRPLYAGADVLSHLLCSLNIRNICDNFVKKAVSEIRKCRQLQGTLSL